MKSQPKLEGRKLFTLFGIPVTIGTDLIVYVTLLSVLLGVLGGLKGSLYILGLFITVYTSILFHEYGHCYAVRAFGQRVDYIHFSMLGGAARCPDVDRLGPKQSLIMALAGPAVNVVLASVLVVAMLATGQAIPNPFAKWHPGNFVQMVFCVNVVLFVFNMIPCWPMDGGRTLESFCRMGLGEINGRLLAYKIGMACSSLMLGYGCWKLRVVLILIGLSTLAIQVTQHKELSKTAKEIDRLYEQLFSHTKDVSGNSYKKQV